MFGCPQEILLLVSCSESTPLPHEVCNPYNFHECLIDTIDWRVIHTNWLRYHLRVKTNPNLDKEHVLRKCISVSSRVLRLKKQIRYTHGWARPYFESLALI